MSAATRDPAPARAEATATRRLPTITVSRADTLDPDWHPDLDRYQRIVVAYSGGKDSTAILLRLLDLGVPRERIELWHHDIDGAAGPGGSDLMDWQVTAAYSRAVADALGLPLFLSWKVGGFERELLRDSARTAPIAWEEPDDSGTIAVRQKGGDRGKFGTRLRFPQVSADLRVRWCSAYLKIDVCDRVLRNDPRFQRGGRFLVVTGERAQESAARSRYQVFEPHRSDTRNGKRRPRYVDHWRPAHQWPEERVWQTIEAHGIIPHPAYRAGWGRVSCAACIFGSPDQWASLRILDRRRFEQVAAYEERFGVTIHRTRPVIETAEMGNPYAVLDTEAGQIAAAEAISRTWDRPVIAEAGAWRLPAGAFGDNAGPT